MIQVIYLKFIIQALCVPRSCLSNTAMLSADIAEIDTMEKLEETIDKISEVIVDWNSTKLYKANGGDKRIYGNCQEFIDSICIKLGIKINFDGPLAEFLQKLRDSGKSNLMHESWSTQNHIIGMYGMYAYDLINDLLPFTPRTVIFNNFFVIVKKEHFYNNSDTVEAQIIMLTDIKPLHFIPEYDDSLALTIYAIDNGSIDISSAYSFQDRSIFGKKYDYKVIGHTPFDSCMKKGGVKKLTISIDTAIYTIINSQCQYLENYLFTSSFFYSINRNVDNSLNEIFIMSSGQDPNMINIETYKAFKTIDNLPPINSYKNLPIIQPTLFCLDISTFTFTSYYSFPIGSISFHPQFVLPNYVVCLVKVFTSNSISNEVWIFDSRNISSGPITKMKDPSIKLTNFMTHATVCYNIVPRNTNYKIPYEEWLNFNNINKVDRIKIEHLLHKYDKTK